MADNVPVVGVDGFALALGRLYQPDTHMWVARAAAGDPGTARVGMDPLGVETSGTLAQLSLPPAGMVVTAGQPCGQLEAAKFVGPLVSPVSGTVIKVNDAVVADAGLVERDPYDEGWLFEVRLADTGSWLDGLLSDPDEVSRWFAAKIADYRLKGVIAQ